MTVIKVAATSHVSHVSHVSHFVSCALLDGLPRKDTSLYTIFLLYAACVPRRSRADRSEAKRKHIRHEDNSISDEKPFPRDKGASKHLAGVQSS